MKPDLSVQEDVAEELAFDPSIESAGIGVAAKDGIVTLSGTVPSYAHKIAAERAARRVAGVHAVACELIVEIPALHRRNDNDIAAAALNALAWESTIPIDAVTVTVARGWITLHGRVEWPYQKDNAKRAVRHLIGVTGVTNRIIVTPRATSADVRKQLHDVFVRSAEIDASHVEAETHDGVVTLRGTVRSWAAHDDASRAAASVPGVTNVENLTTIGG